VTVDTSIVVDATVVFTVEIAVAVVLTVTSAGKMGLLTVTVTNLVDVLVVGWAVMVVALLVCVKVTVLKTDLVDVH
jgi:hypothetical protein